MTKSKRVAMLPAERLEKMKQIVQSRGAVRVSDLCHELNVSAVTVRNDLSQLEKQGVLARSHGGAVALEPSKLGYERPFREQEGLFAAEKERIGRLAASLVCDGDVVIFDVGTTTTQVARHLSDNRRVVVVTNSLNIALELERFPQVRVLVMGGTLRPLQHSLVNPYATLLLSQVHADKLFLGCNGISTVAGVTNANLQEAEVKQAMIKAAKAVIVVADGSKIGVVAAAHIANLTEIDVLITDKSASQQELAKISEEGIQIHVV